MTAYCTTTEHTTVHNSKYCHSVYEYTLFAYDKHPQLDMRTLVVGLLSAQRAVYVVVHIILHTVDLHPKALGLLYVEKQRKPYRCDVVLTEELPFPHPTYNSSNDAHTHRKMVPSDRSSTAGACAT